jgi:type IVB pilus formation R64 PilN family outer membrane protein
MGYQNLQKLSAICLCGAVAMSGCSVREAARQDIGTMSKSADYALQQTQHDDNLVSPLIVENSPWFGSEAIPMDKNEILPAALDDDQALVITFDQPLTLEQVAARIQAATNVRVMIEPGQNLAASGGNGALTNVATSMTQERFLPADGLEVTGGRMVWQGKLSNLLDQIADRFDAQWIYTGKAIQISQHITRTYMLHSLAGVVGVGGSVRTGASASDGSLPQQSVDTTAKISMWEEIQKSIESIIGNKARASFSPATGTITISGYPSSVVQAESYLRMQNKLRLRRVAIETRVLSVNLKKAFENRLDLDLVFQRAFGGQGFQFRSLADTTSGAQTFGGIISAGEATGNSTVNLQLLNNIADDVTVEHTGSLVTLSDQPAPLQVATKLDYVKRVTAATTGVNGVSTSIEPGTLDLGLTMNIMPRVIEQDRVMLRVALGITDLVALTEFESGDSKVQLPRVDTTGFLQNAVLQSGETLVLAGFERQSANENTSGTIWPWNIFLGGRQAYGHGREVRVLLIRAMVLPEEPIDVIKPMPSER